MGIEEKLFSEIFSDEEYQQLILDDNKIVDVNVWNGHEAQINHLFTLYKDKVNPLISVYNALENSFPIGVINELRDVFSHLTQSLIVIESTEVDRHLDKATRHLKRAIVDAFKYASMAYSKVYDDFKESYKHVDLGYVDNGQFLPKLTSLNTRAEQLMHEAKMIESGIHDDDEMYVAYEKAFNCYAALYACIIKSIDAAESIKLKASEDEEVKQREHRIDRIIGIIGVVVGVAGILIGFFV